MRAPRRLAWGGQKRSLPRVALLFLITAGAYWPIWTTRLYTWLRARAPDATRLQPLWVAVLLIVPVVNLAFAVVLALDLPRAVRRAAARQEGRPSVESEPLAVLLLAAPSAAIAIAIAVGLDFWLVGYLAWPLELPAALALQRTLNRWPAGDVGADAVPPGRLDGEVAGSLGIMIVGVVAVAVALAAGGEDDDKPAPPPRVQYSDIAADARSLWVTRIDKSTVLRLDPATLRPNLPPTKVQRTPFDVTTGYGSTWVADYQGDAVSRIDPRSGRELAHIDVGRGPFGIATGLGSVWVTDFVDRYIVRIDPRRNRVLRKIPVAQGPRGIDVGYNAVWAASADAYTVNRFDPGSRKTTRIIVGSLAQDVAVGGGRVWVVTPQDNTVRIINPATNRLLNRRVIVGLGPSSIDYGAGFVWVANANDGTVSRIDPRRAKVVGKPIEVGGQVSDVTVRGSKVWALRSDGKVRRIAG